MGQHIWDAPVSAKGTHLLLVLQEVAEGLKMALSPYIACNAASLMLIPFLHPSVFKDSI